MTNLKYETCLYDDEPQHIVCLCLTCSALRCLARVRLPSPPGFVRNAVEDEACHGVGLAKPGQMSRRSTGGLRPGKPALESTVQIGYRHGKTAMAFSYVYILVSEADPQRHYVGLTDDLNDRLRRHNAGDVPHTSKYRPWRVETVVAFSDRAKAAAFEIYLKSHSGRTFAKRRL